MRFAVLASSSAGNCTYVESGETRILIDAGTNCKCLRERLEPLGAALDRLDAVLLTHEHSDHVAALPVLEKRFAVPLYGTDGTLAAFETEHRSVPCADWPCSCFEPGQPFQIGSILVEPFSIPHDAADPVGYVLSDGESKLGVATDIGFADPVAEYRLRGCTALALEFNHDPQMLAASGRAPRLISRIRGRSGHLSNPDAAALLAAVATPTLRHVVPMHVSGECNRPALAVAAARDALRGAGLDPDLVREPAFPTPFFDC